VQQAGLEWFSLAYGKSLKFNAQENLFRFPNGASLELQQVESDADLAKMAGRSQTLIIVDEITEYQSLNVVDKLRANLRSVAGHPLRFVVIGNPGGPGHGNVAQRWAFHEPWVPFYESKSKRKWILCPSTYLDNDAIDRDAYRQQLESATATDQELQRAWVSNDWHVNRGAYWSAVLDFDRNSFDPEPWTCVPDGWDAPWLGFDFGVSAPSVCYVIARSPGAMGPDGRFYPRDSLLALDEMATNRPDSLAEGLRRFYRR